MTSKDNLKDGGRDSEDSLADSGEIADELASIEPDGKNPRVAPVVFRPRKTAMERFIQAL